MLYLENKVFLVPIDLNKLFSKDVFTTTAVATINPSADPATSEDDDTTVLIAGCISGIVLLVLIIVIVLLIRRCKRKEKAKKKYVLCSLMHFLIGI